MKEDIMSLIYNDEQMLRLYDTNPYIHSCIIYCQSQGTFSTTGTLFQVIKILAEQNKSLNDRLLYEIQHKTNQIFINKDSLL